MSDRGSRCFGVLGFALLATGCGVADSAPDRSGRETVMFAAADSPPVVTESSVVAFWLPAVDSLPEAERQSAEQQFQRSNRMLATYLGATDIALIGSLSDSVVVQLAGGKRRAVVLSGLDFPYGYVLIEPGYAEEFHTGLEAAEHLQAAIDDYFGLEEDGAAARPRIANRRPDLPRSLIALR